MPRGTFKLGTMQILMPIREFELRLLRRVYSQTEKRRAIPIARAISRGGNDYAPDSRSPARSLRRHRQRLKPVLGENRFCVRL